MDLDLIREKLVDSIHSDELATQFFESKLQQLEMALSLCAICAPYDKYTDDCRMQAAYFLSQATPEVLGQVIPLLSVLVTVPSANGEDMNGNIACHLLAAIKKGVKFHKGGFYLDLDQIAKKYGCPQST